MYVPFLDTGLNKPDIKEILGKSRYKIVIKIIEILLGLLPKMFLFVGDEYLLYYSFYFSIYFKHFITKKFFWEWSRIRGRDSSTRSRTGCFYYFLLS